MKLTQEQFNHYLLRQIIQLQAEKTVLFSAINVLSTKLFGERATDFLNNLKPQIQVVYEKLLIDHPLVQEESDSDLSTWLDR